MTTATINGTQIAQSDETVVVEGNHYFPVDSIEWSHFEPTEHSTVCPWKGTASYFTVTVGDDSLENVAWTYKTPKDEAAEIKDYVAFYSQVTVEG